MFCVEYIQSTEVPEPGSANVKRNGHINVKNGLSFFYGLKWLSNDDIHKASAKVPTT